MGRYGSSPNQVALTFDDGPDPEWTPKILDVLKREHATATFFLIGIEADRFSGIAQRIYQRRPRHREPHFHSSGYQQSFGSYMKVEVNLTERLFASRLGIRTLFFRPPYSIDSEPDTEDRSSAAGSSRRTWAISPSSDKIDPNDWRDDPHPTAEQIAIPRS